MPDANTTSTRPSKPALYSGWFLTAAIALFIGSGGINSMRKAPFVVAGISRFSFPVSALPAMGAAALLCVVLFVIPRTAALGAILLTAYFGGAVATHARVGDPSWPAPVAFAIVTWVALLLRDPRFHIIRPSRYRTS